MATTDAKKPSAAGTAFQWISRIRPLAGAPFRRSLMLAATRAAITDSVAAPYQAALKPPVRTSNSASGGPNARPR